METINYDQMMSDRQSALKKMQAYGLAAFDLGLYLNTHPADKRALEMHADVVAKLSEERTQFQKKYGPLTAGESVNTEYWDWIKDPWPWDIQ